MRHVDPRDVEPAAGTIETSVYDDLLFESYLAQLMRSRGLTRVEAENEVYLRLSHDINVMLGINGIDFQAIADDSSPTEVAGTRTGEFLLQPSTTPSPPYKGSLNERFAEMVGAVMIRVGESVRDSVLEKFESLRDGAKQRTVAALIGAIIAAQSINVPSAEAAIGEGLLDEIINRAGETRGDNGRGVVVVGNDRRGRHERDTPDNPPLPEPMATPTTPTTVVVDNVPNAPLTAVEMDSTSVETAPEQAVDENTEDIKPQPSASNPEPLPQGTSQDSLPNSEMPPEQFVQFIVLEGDEYVTREFKIQQIVTETIGPGMTMWDLAKKYYGSPFSWGIIAQFNGIEQGGQYNLQPGQTLRIPIINGNEMRVVAEGDSLLSIAEETGVGPDALIERNPFVNDEGLNTGDKLEIPGQKPGYIIAQALPASDESNAQNMGGDIATDANAPETVTAPYTEVESSATAPETGAPTSAAAPESTNTTEVASPETVIPPESITQLIQRFIEHPNIEIRDELDFNQLLEALNNAGQTWIQQCDEEPGIMHGMINPNLLRLLIEAADQDLNIRVFDVATADAHSCTSLHGQGPGQISAIDLAYDEALYRFLDEHFNNGNVYGGNELIYADPPAGTTTFDRGVPHVFSNEVIEGHDSHIHVGMDPTTTNPVSNSESTAPENSGNTTNDEQRTESTPDQTLEEAPETEQLAIPPVEDPALNQDVAPVQETDPLGTTDFLIVDTPPEDSAPVGSPGERVITINPEDIPEPIPVPTDQAPPDIDGEFREEGELTPIPPQDATPENAQSVGAVTVEELHINPPVETPAPVEVDYSVVRDDLLNKLPEIRELTREQTIAGERGAYLSQEDHTRLILAAIMEGNKPLWETRSVLLDVVATFWGESGGVVNARNPDEPAGPGAESNGTCQMLFAPAKPWGSAETRLPENNLDVFQHLNNCYITYVQAGATMDPWMAHVSNGGNSDVYVPEFEPIIDKLLTEYGLRW